jgi:hypothetical protein
VYRAGFFLLDFPVVSRIVVGKNRPLRVGPEKRKNDFMKTLGTLAVLGVLGFGVHNAVMAPPSVEAATTTVANTQRQLKEAAAVSLLWSARWGSFHA